MCMHKIGLYLLLYDWLSLIYQFNRITKICCMFSVICSRWISLHFSVSLTRTSPYYFYVYMLAFKHTICLYGTYINYAYRLCLIVVCSICAFLIINVCFFFSLFLIVQYVCLQVYGSLSASYVIWDWLKLLYV
jgi:hypothetical protein